MGLRNNFSWIFGVEMGAAAVGTMAMLFFVWREWCRRSCEISHAGSFKMGKTAAASLLSNFLYLAFAVAMFVYTRSTADNDALQTAMITGAAYWRFAFGTFIFGALFFAISKFLSLRSKLTWVSVISVAAGFALLASATFIKFAVSNLGWVFFAFGCALIDWGILAIFFARLIEYKKLAEKSEDHERALHMFIKFWILIFVGGIMVIWFFGVYGLGIQNVSTANPTFEQAWYCGAFIFSVVVTPIVMLYSYFSIVHDSRMGRNLSRGSNSAYDTVARGARSSKSIVVVSKN
jgi:hypothetical protein